ncbi:hypothetical protein [Sphingomonas pituitosa]|uniref:hypothetical protein n=1 Tax=Sphingomonas pituitosa TaxID=99597 RepID=UPI000A07313C|nr:hypothetical protein [Sphingomonas pituitosa]
MESLKIIAFATLAAIVYGIVHDQVTAHLCVEYFTIAHPPVFPTTSPFLLALGWGVIATWWVGLPLGILLAIVARAGRAPRLALADLRGAILRLMLVSAIGALLAGGIGAAATALRFVTISEYWARVIPPGKHVAFLADAWAHGASYLIGAIGGLVVIGYAIARRRQLCRA